MNFFTKLFYGEDNRVKDSADTVQDVPGSPGCSVINLIKLLWTGHNFYRKRRDENKSKIFQVNISGVRVVLCSHELIQYIYTNPHLFKEPGFGGVLFNKKILDNHLPLIFENGELHNQRRKIFIELPKLLFCKESFLQDTFKLVETEMEMCNNNNNHQKANVLEDFETAIGNCVYNILSMVLFGVRLDNDMTQVWFDNCLLRDSSGGKEEAVTAYRVLQDAIKQAPKFQLFMENVKSSGIQVSESEVCNELLFSFIFNGGAALKILAISMVVMLKQLTDDELDLLKTECQQFISGGFQMQDFQKMVNIESFVLENLRLFPPAPYMFRRVQQDFILSIKTGKFQITNGDLLCGNVYLSNRDPEVFEDADQFRFQRFQQNPMLSSYLTSFGITTTPNEIQQQENSCAGPKIALMLAQMILCQLLRATYDFSAEPKYTGSNLRRFMASDKPVQMKTFHIDGFSKQ